jgi:hypothetical protein
VLDFYQHLSNMVTGYNIIVATPLKQLKTAIDIKTDLANVHLVAQDGTRLDTRALKIITAALLEAKEKIQRSAYT